MQDQGIYVRLGRLFEYPADEYGARARRCLEQMNLEQPEAAQMLAEFCGAIQGLNTDQLQELFTRTFDLNPVCTLEIGWHLYGEDYQRGEFLVKMRQQLRDRGIEESIELPDHLTHALILLQQMEPDEASDFAGRYLLPALHQMRAGWQKNRNAFAVLLESAFVLLKSRYSYEPLPDRTRVPELRILQ